MAIRAAPAPNVYRHNLPTACALLPALLVLAGYGGQVVMGTFLVGFMVAYILDYMQYREGSFTALWITLIAANLGLVMTNSTFSPLRLFAGSAEWIPIALEGVSRPPLLDLMLLFVGGQTLLLVGCWGTLQFKWIQQQYPVVVFAVEKLVIQMSLPVASVMHGWGLTAAVGADAAPYYFAIVLCLLYKAFCLPMPASFTTGKAKAGEVSTVQEKALSGFQAWLVVSLPTALYAATHHRSLASWEHFWGVMLLASIPVLWICTLSDGLWWFGSSQYTQDTIRKSLSLVALGTGLAGLEGRVVFKAFEQFLTLHPPWSYLLVTAALYGAAALVVMHVTGVLGHTVDSAVAGVVLVLSAAGGSMAMGMPLMVVPAPLCAAAGMALYYDSRLLRDYVLFLAGSLATAGWFVSHYFWFLQIQMGTFSVRFMCQLLMAVLATSLSLPGIVISTSSRAVVGWIMSLQAFLICIAEEHLFAGSHGAEMMYPAYVVVVTSALGALVTHKVASMGQMSPFGCWACYSAYAAKLSMLLVPEAYMVQPTLLLALAASAPAVLYPNDADEGLSSRHRPAKLKPWQGVVHGLTVIFAVGVGRFAIFDTLHWLTSSRPSEATAASSLLLVAALGCVPLVSRHYPQSSTARNVLLTIVTLAMVLFMLRPPFPVQSGAKCPHLPFGLCPRLWDEKHAPYHEVDDVSIYGTGASRRTHEPVWLLVAAVCCGLLSLAPSARLSGPSAPVLLLKILAAAAGSSCVAGYVALEFFRHCFSLQLLLWVSMLLVGLCVVLLQANENTIASSLLVFAAWLATFPLAVAIESSAELPPLSKDALRLFPDSARDVTAERHMMRSNTLLALFATQAVLIAFVTKLRVSVLLKPGKGRSSSDGGPLAMLDGPDAFLGPMPSIPTACLPGIPFPTRGGKKAFRGSSGSMVGWLASAGNAATLMGFSLALMLCYTTAGGMDASIFALAPLLLLLIQDDLLLRSLHVGRRYFPPALAVVVYLSASAGNQILEYSFFVHPEYGTKSQSTFWYFVRNALCLLACLPTHAGFLKYLWEWTPQPDSQLLILTPLNLLAVGVTDLETTRLLAVLALVASCIQHLSMRQQTRHSMRVI